MRNDWWQSFVDLVRRIPFRNNAANACSTAYVEAGDILYQAFDLRNTNISRFSITNNPWFMMSSYDFVMDTDKRRQSNNTHLESSNADASEGDR